MSLALYRKYRPRKFSEVEGQENIVKAIKGAFLTGRVGHAFLFCGPRGTGKTTLARLLSKALNCEKLSAILKKEKIDLAKIEPCNNCFSCKEINESRSMDIIEIDAASNRGIDEIRDVKDSASVAATSSNFKIFIIDEVHMLTPPAFNALLKILEEPPSHVVFVLATTEPHKVPETVLSRTQRFDFKKIPNDKISKKLNMILIKEEVRIEEGVLTAIALNAGGSLRDAESILGKLISYAGFASGEPVITAEHVTEVLGIIPTRIYDDLLSSIFEKRPNEAVGQINKLYESGIDLDNFLKQFLGHLRRMLIGSFENQGAPQLVSALPDGTALRFDSDFLMKVITVLMRAQTELRYSPVPQLPLELAIFDLTK